MIAALQERLTARFTFVVGKGGVGKTTAACAIALAAADAHSTTHLISTDPAHSLADVFQQTLTSSPAPSDCNPDLLPEELDARAAAARWLERAQPALLDLIEKGTYLDAEDARALLDLTLPGVDEIMGAVRLAELAQSDCRASSWTRRPRAMR